MKRDPYMDNLRCLLIFLVVLAHFLSKLPSINEYQYLHNFIYIFHMPLFVFVSGYFSKHIVKNGVFQSQRLLSIFWLFCIFKGMTHLIYCIYNGFYSLKLLDVSSAPWYLICLCLWYLMIPFIRYYKPKLVLICSFVIAILVGYDQTVGQFLSLSRAIVFFPFFLIGYYLSNDQLKNLLEKRLRIPAALLLLGAFILSLLKGDVISPYIRFTYGASSYASILKEDYLLRGPVLRLTWYVIAIILSVSVMYLIPRCHRWFTYIGQRTLSIYILHILIRNVLVYEGFFDALMRQPKVYTLSVFFLCIGIVLICSCSIIYKPFSYLMSHPFFIKPKKNR